MEKQLKRGLHVVLRGTVYYYNRRIPLDLLDEYRPASKVYESLNTSDLSEANKRAAKRTAQLDEEWAGKRAYRSSAVIEALPDEMQEAILAHWAAEQLARDDDERVRGHPRPAGMDSAEDANRDFLGDVKEAYAEGNWRYMASTADRLLKDHGAKLSPNAYRAFALALLAKAITVAEAIDRRFAGRPVPTPKTAPVAPLGIKAISKEDTLTALFEYWKKKQQPVHRGAQEAEQSVREFERICGKRAATQYTRDDVIKFRDTLSEEVAAKGHSLETAKKKMNLIGAIYAVALDANKVPFNPFNGVTRPGPKKKQAKERKRYPYTIEDLNALFALPVFTAGERPEGGAGEAAYWLPLLAAFTGARLTEMGQLHCSDVKTRLGIHFIDFAPDSANGKKLKTASSVRVVPVHKTLERLGFLDYVAEMRAAGHERLFPQIRSNSPKREITAAFSQWWGRYARTVVKDTKKTFHSFRHSFKDACRDSGLHDEIHDRLTGHAGGRGVGGDYGTGPSLAKLAADLQRVKYAGLKLPAKWKRDDLKKAA